MPPFYFYTPEEILYSGLNAPNERDEEKKGLTM